MWHAATVDRFLGDTGAAILANAASGPPVEWVGWAVFLVLLAFFVGLYLWAMRRNRARAQAAAPPPDTDEALAAHHTVVWSGERESFQAQPHHVPLAIGAIFAICRHDPWDELYPGAGVDEAQMLRESWGIASRPQLLTQLYWLITAGHRVEFEAEQRAASSIPDDRAAEREKELRVRAKTSEQAAEELWRWRRMRADDRGISTLDFTAWDLVRVIMLARAGLAAGYLSEAEALDTLAYATTTLQRRYRSWEDLGSQFLRGRWYWAGAGGEIERESDRHDASRQQALLTPGNGPWPQVPWLLPVPASRLLLLDALLAEELIEPLSPRARAGARSEALALDDALRRRLDLPPFEQNE